MKNFKLIITIAILTAFVYSCNNSAVQRMMEEPVEPERAVGMSDWAGVKDMKWHIVNLTYSSCIENIKLIFKYIC